MIQSSDEERKQQIRSAATRCFVRRGFEATRLVDIAKEAGLSKGGIYFHYKTKHELFQEIMERHVRGIERRWDFEPCCEQPADRLLCSLVAAHLRTLEEDPEQTRLYNLLITLAAQEPEFRTKLEEALRVIRCLYSKLIGRGIEQGLFVDGDAGELASTIMATVTGLGALSVLHGSGRLPVPPDDAATRVVSMISRVEVRQPS